MDDIVPVNLSLDQIKKIGPAGGEYWMARDLQAPLGYARWENFQDVIKKARMSCESSGSDPDDHILQTTKMVSVGSGAQRGRIDYYVSRLGAYLICMNGDPGLPCISAAQNYFAVQTRKQEVLEQFGIDVNKRLELRDRVKSAVKHLGDAAKDAGVQNYALFHEAGYLGLYEMGLGKIKEMKGIDSKESLLDRAGRQELAANEFRITQTEEVIRKENIKGDIAARNTHKKIGQAVRQTIKDIGGTMPEDLPAETSIKQIGKQMKKQRALTGGTRKKDSD